MVPTLYPANRDLSKVWFVSYQCRETGKIKKKYGRMAHLPTVEERIKESERIIRDEIGYYPPAVAQVRSDLPAMLEQFYNYRKVGLRAKSVITYRTMVESFVRWYRLHWKGGEDEVMALEYMGYLNSNGMGATTRNNYRSLLKSLFEKMVDAGKLDRNPFKQTQKSRERRKTKEWFRQEQIDQLKQAMLVNDQQLWLACRLMFYCFIRPGNEMQHLQIKDIDIAQRRICIKSEYSKSGSNDEFAMIPDQLVADLAQYLAYPRHFYLFGLYGMPGIKFLGKATLYRRHEKLLDDFNYPDGFVFYSWKNTGAIHMLQQGISILHISKLMRHRSLDYTREYFKSLGFSDFNVDISKMMPVI